MILKNIKEFLKRYPRICYPLMMYRDMRNQGVYKSFFLIESFGDKNQDKTIYYIKSDTDGILGSGFCAAHREMLNALYVADKFNFTPVIDYTSGHLYINDRPINGTENPFEYYFEPVSDITKEDVYNSNCVIFFKHIHSPMAENEYGKLKSSISTAYIINDENIKNLANITNKYIKLNKYVEPIICKGIHRMINGKKTLGVHFRGTDYKQNFDRHVVYVSITEYIDAIKDVLKKDHFERLFLATDDEYALKAFKEEFNEVLYYDDVTRSNGDESVAYVESSRQNHKYLLGLEVLRDVYTLANCDGLVAGKSNVSTCALITKKSYGKEYNFIHIIDKGLNQNNNSCKRYYKRHVPSR